MFSVITLPAQFATWYESSLSYLISNFFFQAEDGIRDADVTGVQTCALPIFSWLSRNVDSPVSFSPLIMAQLMGAAPRYFGNNEACRLKVPLEGRAQTISGNILKIGRASCRVRVGMLLVYV